MSAMGMMAQSAGECWLRAMFPLLACAALPWADAVEAAANGSISYVREVAPILQRHCNGCHHPGKQKGDVDLTSVRAMARAGRHGIPVVAGKPAESVMLLEVKGSEPAMPKEGGRLSEAQVAVLERWIREGALDDTPPPPGPPTEPPGYEAPPVLGAMDWSPDGRWLAVAGRGEVLVMDAVRMIRLHRLLGAPRKIEALRFSPDGKSLAVAGGEPGVRGIYQRWLVDGWARETHAEVGHDVLMALDWHPDGKRVATGSPDRMVRVLSATDGTVRVAGQVHADWVLGVAWVDDGRRLVSGGRDRSLRLLDGGTLRLLDVVNREGEPVVRLARRPVSEQVAFAGAESRARLYQAFVRPSASDPGQDPNHVREFDAWPGGATALAFSPDGQWIATAGAPSGVSVQRVEGGGRVARMEGHGGVVFGLAFDAKGERLATAGIEGRLRVYSLPSGVLLTNWVPVEVGR